MPFELRPELWRKVEPILDRALQLPPDQRQAYIDEACAGDPELVEAVNALIAADAEASRGFLEPLGDSVPEMLLKFVTPGPGSEAPAESMPLPETIGGYRIIEVLGEGGMGIVYLADQTEPLKRRVAIKVIKLGMDTTQVVARFEAERQALAVMDHPSIAKVFDAGATPDGRPYFVMEYVAGVPITEYCDRERLGMKARLDLFAQVCGAIQHAHQKGVVHRDIKPSNVLVTEGDDKPAPKVIDFGIAKAVEQRLTERTLFTEHGMLVGTPVYMSPEQADPAGLDIDTRTDVYSLGVLLYEILTGSPPFDPQELRRAGFGKIQRIIRETDPPRPSSRLRTLPGESSSGIAERRDTDYRALVRQVEGELDWVVMKAIEKDRARRYGSPSDLAEDIRKHLDNEPVIAGPPTAAYRAKKFVRRHRAGVAVAVSGVLLLVAFGVAMAVQAGRIAAERDRANREAKAKGEVSEFLKDLFRVSDPGEARGNSITARELLDKGAAKIEDKLEEQPEIAAELMATMGEVYRVLGLYSDAEPLLERAVALRQEQLGKDHFDTLASMNNLGALYSNQGRNDEAEALYLETLQRRTRTLGRDHPSTLVSRNNLAIQYFTQDRFDEAEPLYIETLEVQRSLFGDDNSHTLRTVNNLAVLYDYRQRYDEAEVLYVEALEGFTRLLGDDHPETLRTMNNLGLLYVNQGRYDDAEPLYREAVETRKRVLGPEHPSTLNTMGGLVHLYLDQGRDEDAEPLARDLLELSKRVRGEDHPDTLHVMTDMTNLYWRLGRYSEAEPMYRELLEVRRRVLGDEHPSTLSSINNLGGLLIKEGKFEEAGVLLRSALETRLRVLDERHLHLGYSHYNLGCLAAALGDREAALEHLRKAVDLQWAERAILEDEVLNALRGDPEFVAILDEVKRRLGED